MEFLAAIYGLYYLKKKPDTRIVNKYFVYYLWYVFINEMICNYAVIGYFSNYKYFSFIENSVFSDNVWLYNIYFIVSFSFLFYYFSYFFKNKKRKRSITKLIFLYIISSIIYLMFSGAFFKTDSEFSLITGSLILLLVIIQFYFDILRSDKIINLKKFLPIYISIGVLVYNLCITPILLFSHYFNINNDVYILIRTNIILITNIFMYGTFITGFIVCAKDKNKTDEII